MTSTFPIGDDVTSSSERPRAQGETVPSNVEASREACVGRRRRGCPGRRSRFMLKREDRRNLPCDYLETGLERYKDTGGAGSPGHTRDTRVSGGGAVHLGSWIFGARFRVASGGVLVEAF
jgi:hypothetical protein